MVGEIDRRLPSLYNGAVALLIGSRRPAGIQTLRCAARSFSTDHLFSVHSRTDASDNTFGTALAEAVTTDRKVGMSTRIGPTRARLFWPQLRTREPGSVWPVELR
jgi:hypothetical protein